MQLVKIIIAGDFVHLKSLQVEEGAQAVITSENIKVLYNAQSNNKNMWRTLYASQDDNLIILCSNIENGKIKNNNTTLTQIHKYYIMCIMQVLPDFEEMGVSDGEKASRQLKLQVLILN